MEHEKVQAAIREAERFLERARKVEDHMAHPDRYPDYRLTAAARRASMDLSHALADLRRRP